MRDPQIALVFLVLIIGPITALAYFLTKAENASETNIPSSMTMIERLDHKTVIVEIRGRKFIIIREARMLAMAPWGEDATPVE